MTARLPTRVARPTRSLFLVDFLRRGFMHGSEDLAIAGVDVNLLDAALSRHLDVIRINQATVFDLEIALGVAASD